MSRKGEIKDHRILGKQRDSGHNNLSDLFHQFWDDRVQADDETAKALTVRQDGRIKVPGYTFTPVGIIPDTEASEMDWIEAGKTLMRLRGSLQWLIGDWLLDGDRVWRRSYEEMAQMTGLNIKTLYNYVYVCNNVDFSLRKEKLTMTHHMLVSGLAPDEQAYWLNMADQENWSVMQMRKELDPNSSRRGKGKRKPPPLSRQALTHIRFREHFDQLFDDLHEGRAVRAENISQIRAWLEEIERTLKREEKEQNKRERR